MYLSRLCRRLHRVPRPSRILRVIVAMILWLITPKRSGFINSLPAESAQATFELLAFSDHNTLPRCMRVCRRWHDIARLHFFAIVRSGSRQCGRLFQLLSADPGLAPYVKHVRFERGCRFWWWCEACQQDSSRDSFYVRSLASALRSLRLINLRYLSLTLYGNLIDHPLPSECLAQSRRIPVHSN